jgi:hypothetical protein
MAARIGFRGRLGPLRTFHRKRAADLARRRTDEPSGPIDLELQAVFDFNLIDVAKRFDIDGSTGDVELGTSIYRF